MSIMCLSPVGAGKVYMDGQPRETVVKLDRATGKAWVLVTFSDGKTSSPTWVEILDYEAAAAIYKK